MKHAPSGYMLKRAWVPQCKLQYKWLRPKYYADEDTPRLAVWAALKAVGNLLTIAVSPFKKSTV